MAFTQPLLSKPLLFATTTLLLCMIWSWPRRWLISGAPLLQYFILLGDAKGYRVLPYIHLWPIFSTLHLLYAISSTSWLLYWVFTALCYPGTFFVCLFQFGVVGAFVRRQLRSALRELHFIDDKIAFFNIPALEIDTEVDGLMVLRGVTFSLSTLSLVVHGVEVGIKLSDDMELAIQTEEVVVKLFRTIEIGDCYANLKGGEFEMTFGGLEGKSKDADGDAVFIEDTPLLKAATREGDRRRLGSIDSGVNMDGSSGGKPPPHTAHMDDSRTKKMTTEMTEGARPKNSTLKDSFTDVERFCLDNEEASGRYHATLEFIQHTNMIHEAREHVENLNREAKELDDEKGFDALNDGTLRAAICSQVHQKASVPHPPQKSIKVTTIQNLLPPYIRGILHRLPMLLRLLLNPLSYFHPVHISSITATASGRWIDSILTQKLFQDYAVRDSEVRSLQSQVSHWLSDANFAIGLAGITGLAQVPFLPTYDIICQLAFEDIMAHRAEPLQLSLKEVVRLGGADARFQIPSFLLPHHEHLLPPIPSTTAFLKPSFTPPFTALEKSTNP